MTNPESSLPDADPRPEPSSVPLADDAATIAALREALRASEARVREMVDDAVDAIYTEDLDHCFSDVNRMAEILSGYSRDELIGMSRNRVVAPESLVIVQRAGDQKHNGAAATTVYEIDLIRKDGIRVPVEIHNRLVYRDGVVAGVQGVVRDISARRRGQALLERQRVERAAAEAELARSRERIQAMVESVDAILWEADPRTFDVSFINGRAEQILGYSREAWLAPGFWQSVILDEDREHCIQYSRQASAAGRDHQFEYRMRAADGRIVWVRDIVTVVKDDAGQPAFLRGVMIDVTERKVASETAERLAAVVEASPDAIMTRTLDGTIESWNPGAELMFGFTAEEAIGRQVDLIVPPEQLAAYAAGRLRTDSGQSLRELETIRMRRDGSRINVLLTTFPVYDSAGTMTGVCTILRDVSDRIAAERAAPEAAADLAAVMDSTHDMVTLVSPGCDVILFNRAAAATTLRTSGRLLRQRAALRDYVSPELWPTERARIERALTGEVVTVEEERRVGDELLSVELSYLPVRVDEDRIRGVACVVRDVTGRHESAAAMLESQKLESLGVLAGGIAHDFNNLLVGVIGNADLALLDLPADSPARPAVNDIRLAGHSLSELAQQMLAYSGRSRFVVERTSLNAIIGDMTHLLGAVISKAVHLRQDLASDLPDVEVDVTQIRQVVMNLITNASDAIGPTGGEIVVSTGYLPSAGGRATGHVYVDVSDTGCGMAPETRRRIFDPFFTTKFTGRGLGLAAVQGIVRGHAGEIQVTSALGEGTVFRVALPAAGRAVRCSPTEQCASPVEPSRRGGTVLVVDDESTVRAVTARVLRSLGLGVIEAEDGEAGVEAFRDHAGEIVCTLLDMTMPKLNGVEAFRAIRGIDPAATVVMISGYDEQDALEGLSPGELAGFLKKPYNVATLQGLLTEVLARPAA